MHEESGLRSARSLYSAAALYAGEHAGSVKEAKRKKQGKPVNVWRSRFVPQNWEPCWEEFGTRYKYSGAAPNPDIERSFVDGLLTDEDSDETDDYIKEDAMESAAGPAARPAYRRARPVRGPALMNRPAMGRKALKSRLPEDSAEAASLAACYSCMRVVAESLSRRYELWEQAQELEMQRTALDVFNRPGIKHTPMGKAIQAHMLATMASFDAEPVVSSGASTAATAGTASGGPGADTKSVAAYEGEDGIVVVAGAPAPRADAGAAVNKARGTKSMAMKSALAGAALRGAATIDLNFAPGTDSTAGGSGARDAARVRAPCSTPEDDGATDGE